MDSRRSLEVKLPTIWTDEKQRWEEPEKRRAREEKRRRKEIKEATLVGYFSNYLNILLSMLKGTNQ
jgi:hypothetical protein